MKRRITLKGLFAALLFCGISLTASSQTLKDVFSNSETPLVYLGIDFSKTRILDQGNADDIRNRLYNSINQLVVDEFKKFDIKGAFRKSYVENYASAVSEKNQKANLSDIISNNPSDFNFMKESDIVTAVKGLDIKGKEGVGVVFIMEAMRKVDKKGDAAIWVTFVDLKSKKMLMTERMVEEAKGGFGFRNYWASTIKELIDDIDKKKFKEWKKRYAE
ncbi:MAG: hypothetical protein IPI66_02835 [Chitinophagaceae bacterium]|nr:hypothetical protein [Chitinophagaceae bacterium]MBL0055118.1 hypothetical protein [Chitinophagaceae bacterium]